MSEFQLGERVKWNWGKGEGAGRIVKRYTQHVTLTIKDTEVIRNASDDDPAYLIEQDDGDRVLNGVRELSPASGTMG